MISTALCLMMLIMISSFPILSTLQFPPKAMAQTPSEAMRALADDVIQALKANDAKNANVHLTLLNQQLSSLGNLSSAQSIVKALLDDTNAALKNNETQVAIVHLNLIKQQLSNTTNNPQNTVNAVAPLSQINELSTYTNSTYGILSIQYPSNWTIDETNTQPEDSSAFDIVSFSAPAKSYLATEHPPSLDIRIDSPDQYPQVVSSLSDYLNYMIDLRGIDNTNFKQVASNTSSTLAGNHAYSLKYTNRNTNDNSEYTALEIGAIISDKVLIVQYRADSPSFTKFLPTALKMIGSLRINETAVAQTVKPTPSETAAPPESSISPSPSEEPSQNIAPPVNNENPSNSGTDYSGICAKLQPVLIPSCSTLVNSDGSLTESGTHAMHCIRNGIVLGGGAALYGVPLSIVLKGLSMLAAPTGCDGIVNMKAFDQLGDIGSLSSLTSILP